MKSFLQTATNLLALLVLCGCVGYVAWNAGRKVGRVERLFDRPQVIVKDDVLQPELHAAPPESYSALEELEEAGDQNQLAHSKGW